MPAILQRSVRRKMSTDKENSKSEDIKPEDNDIKNEEKNDSKDDTDEKSAEESEMKEKEMPKRKSSKLKETKKEEKSEDDEEDEEAEEDEEDDEEEDEGEEDEKTGGDGKVPLLDQPLQLSGARERKKVQRFTEEFKAELKDSVAVEIPEGKGTALGLIPRIEANIQRVKAEDLKPLHRILFNRVGKSTMLKKTIRKFNGFDFDKDSDQFDKKKSIMQKLEMKILKSMCDILDLEKKGIREEVADRLITFLLEPKDSGKPVIKPRPTRVASQRANSKGYSESDDEEKRPSRSTRGKGKRVNLKEDSSSDDGPKRNQEKAKDKESEGDVDEADEEATPSSDDSDAPKSKKKTTVRSGKSNAKKSIPKKANAKKTPSKKADKKSTPKKRKSIGKSEDDSSSEDEPLAKKTKTPPTDDEIKTYVKEILEGANLEEITMKTVCKQVYAHYPDFDLAHKKDFIKTTVKSLIST